MDTIIKRLVENHKIHETEKSLKSRYKSLAKLKKKDPDVDEESIIRAIRIHTSNLKDISKEFDELVNSKHQYEFSNAEIHDYLRGIDQQIQFIRKLLRTDK